MTDAPSGQAAGVVGRAEASEGKGASAPLAEPPAPARLPKGWTRRYEPDWSCGAYTLYRDEHAVYATGQPPVYDVEISSLGVTFNYIDHLHLSPEDWNALMGAVYADFASFRESARAAGLCECDNLCADTCPVHQVFGSEPSSPSQED